MTAVHYFSGVFDNSFVISFTGVAESDIVVNCCFLLGYLFLEKREIVQIFIKKFSSSLISCNCFSKLTSFEKFSTCIFLVISFLEDIFEFRLLSDFLLLIKSNFCFICRSNSRFRSLRLLLFRFRPVNCSFRIFRNNSYLFIVITAFCSLASRLFVMDDLLHSCEPIACTVKGLVAFFRSLI